MNKKRKMIFKTKPYKHQTAILKKSYNEPAFAYLMEQGTGKTKPILDHAANLWLTSKIDSLIVVASPMGAIGEWAIDHIPEHMPLSLEQHQLEIWNPATSKKNLKRLKGFADLAGNVWTRFKILLVNVEAFASDKAVDYLQYFLKRNVKCYFVIDESTSIKSHTAQRTKALLKLSQHPSIIYKRIMTGTPSTQSLLDLYTQFKFLDPKILKQKSYYSFRARYCIMRDIKLPTGVSFKKVIGFQPWAMEEIRELIAPYSYRVIKDDCLDLPDKIYETKRIILEPEQKRLYVTLVKELVVEFMGRTLAVDMALKKMLRLQQIVGGFFPSEAIYIDDDTEEATTIKYLTPIFKKPLKNPKLSAVIDILEKLNPSDKAIIFCRFTAEVELLTEILTKHFGAGTTASYYGGVKKKDRKPIITAFQNDAAPCFLVAQLRSASKSLTLHRANAVIYYSNSYSLEDRLQSEDRAHRAGLKHNVTYYDLIAEGTLDVKIIKALKDKKKIADAITGDSFKEWIGGE